jgi:tetratricopeptide (TPR) repeat protein
VAGATQHTFVHALVRDAAYNQLPRSARAERHLAAAEWIESLPEDRAEDRAETLAHHYLTAIELRRAAGEDATAIGPRAVRALREAGERALALSAYRTAASFLKSALELLPPEVEPSPELLLHAGTVFGFIGTGSGELAQAVEAFERAGDPEGAAEAAIAATWQTWHSEPAEARRWLERAGAHLEGRPASRAKALMLAEHARMMMIAYQYETARRLAEQAIEQARSVGDVQIEADAIVTAGCCRTMLGDQRSLEMFEQALALVGHRGRVAGRAYTNLGVAWNAFGEFRRAADVWVAGIDVAERDGDELSAAFMRGNVMGAQLELGDWEDALVHAAAIVETKGPPSYQEPPARATRAIIFEARGAVEDASAEWELAVARSREMGEPQGLWPALVGLIGLRRRQGRYDEAGRALDEVVDAIAASESVGDLQEWHVELLVALREAGRVDDGRVILARMPDGKWRDACRDAIEGEYADAADVLASMGNERVQAEVRLLAARSFTASGRLAEAEAQIERARAFHRRVGATAYLAQADEIVAAAS